MIIINKEKSFIENFIEHIYCQECGQEIPNNKKYIKENCCYVIADYKKCLCPSCSYKLKIGAISPYKRKTQGVKKNDNNNS